MSLIQDPMKWSASMVSSWARFWGFGMFFVLVMACAVYSAAFQGWRSAVGIAFFVAAFQVMTLYALRRLYLMARGGDMASRDDGIKRHHLIFVVAVIIAASIGYGLLLKWPNAV